MKHADALVQRILMLGGLPNLQNLGKLMIGENPEEILGCDYKMELQARKDLLEALAACDKAHDPTSVNLLEEILTSEEKHIEWLEAQLKLIKAMGRENYLQSQV